MVVLYYQNGKNIPFHLRKGRVTLLSRFLNPAVVIFSNLFFNAQWQKVKSIYKQWRILLFGPFSKFKIGDRVQLVNGEGFMLVTEIIAFPGMKEPLLQCKWYDPDSRETRTSIFSEGKITFFEGKSSRRTRVRYLSAEVVSL